MLNRLQIIITIFVLVKLSKDAVDISSNINTTTKEITVNFEKELELRRCASKVVAWANLKYAQSYKNKSTNTVNITQKYLSKCQSKFLHLRTILYYEGNSCLKLKRLPNWRYKLHVL